MTQTLRFTDWQILPAERVLLIRDKPVPIGGRAFDVLLALVDARGAVVSKRDLLDTAWRGLVVEENNLSVQIAALRKLLGAHVIGTVAGRGYRLAVTPKVESDVRVGTRASPGQLGLFGRESDEKALFERIEEAALISIVGTGGVGKTALARALGARRKKERHDAVHWIDLAPVSDATQIVPLAAKVLGIELDGDESADALVAALVNSEALIVIDNCEHVLDAVADLVGRSLDAAINVRWIATSQMPLGLRGEVVYRLRPLDVPAADASISEARASGAIALLCERASSADRHFALDADMLPIAIDLCRQLDGLPLAIEMAAGRTASLGLKGVHEQLGRRLQLLMGMRNSPSRHLTLRSTFDWSYELLSFDERKVFRRLEPFLGGFDIGMASRVTCDVDAPASALDEVRAFDIIGSLVDRSLVQKNPENPDRFFLYESARDYARERLVEAGEDVAALQGRHAREIAALFATARVDHEFMPDVRWTARYLPERHNLRAALAWACRSTDADLLAVLVAALAQLDLFLRQPTEVLRFEIPFALLAGSATAFRAAANLEYGWAHYTEGSCKTGTEHSLLALADFRSMGDTAGVCRALTQLVRLYETRPGMLGEADDAADSLRLVDRTAVPLRTRLFSDITVGMRYLGSRTPMRLDEWLSVAHGAGFDSLVAICSLHATDELLIQQRFAEAAEATKQFIDAGETRPRVLGTMLINRVLALVRIDRDEEASRTAREALRILPSRSHLVLNALALAVVRRGHVTEAAMIVGYCEHMRRAHDQVFDPAEAAAADDIAGMLGEAFGTVRLDDLKRTGSLMSSAEISALALSAAVRPATASVS